MQTVERATAGGARSLPPRRRICALTLSGILWLPLTFAGVFTDDFATDPSARGWRAFGDASLFGWQPAAQRLEVTWDSERPNSYWFRPLGTVIGMDDDFRAGFDLTLSEVAAGIVPGKSYTFQIAAGFFRMADATAPGFHRASAMASPNLVEWDYFPDTGLGATISPVIVSSRSRFTPSFSFPLEMEPGVRYRVEMEYTATDRTLVVSMTADGAPFGPIKPVTLPDNFDGFRADAFGFLSYHSEGGDPRFLGSVLARGVVDNVVLVTPDPPRFAIGFVGTADQPAVRVGTTRPGWRYVLEASGDAANWLRVGGPLPGTGSLLDIPDDRGGAVGAHSLYRVRAEPE